MHISLCLILTIGISYALSQLLICGGNVWLGSTDPTGIPHIGIWPFRTKRSKRLQSIGIFWIRSTMCGSHSWFLTEFFSGYVVYLRSISRLRCFQSISNDGWCSSVVFENSLKHSLTVWILHVSCKLYCEPEITSCRIRSKRISRDRIVSGSGVSDIRYKCFFVISDHWSWKMYTLYMCPL